MKLQRTSPSESDQQPNEIEQLFDIELEEDKLNDAARERVNRYLEDVDYWRKRAGWYDDDVSMSEYNNGVYNSYYSIDDDTDDTSSSNNGGQFFKWNSNILSNVAKICGALIGVVILVMRIRSISRGSARRKKKKNNVRPSTASS